MSELQEKDIIDKEIDSLKSEISLLDKLNQDIRNSKPETIWFPQKDVSKLQKKDITDKKEFLNQLKKKKDELKIKCYEIKIDDYKTKLFQILCDVYHEGNSILYYLLSDLQYLSIEDLTKIFPINSIIKTLKSNNELTENNKDIDLNHSFDLLKLILKKHITIKMIYP